MVDSDTLTVDGNALMVGDDTLAILMSSADSETVDSYTLMSAGGTWTVDDSTLTINGST
jgi:hypothetical protein